MNKQELVAALAKKTGASLRQAEEMLNAFTDLITGSLKKKQEVRLVGFGTFSVTRRSATEGRNPRTGEKIKIPASNQPKFKAGKALKDAVN